MPAVTIIRAAAILASMMLIGGCDSHSRLADSPASPQVDLNSSGSAHSTDPGQAVDTSPRVVSWGEAQDIARFYPTDAQRRGVEGLVTIAVTLDRAGRATDTHIVAEDPPDMGFGAGLARVPVPVVPVALVLVPVMLVPVELAPVMPVPEPP